MKVYLMVQHLNGDDFDYWTFPSLQHVIDWLKDYPIHTHIWTISYEPVGLPESEYTNWEVEI